MKSLRELAKTTAIVGIGLLTTSISQAPTIQAPTTEEKEVAAETVDTFPGTYNFAPWNTDIGTIQRCSMKEEYIKAKAVEYGVSKEDFFGMVGKESLCDELIAHPYGAVGILQTKPQRAKHNGWETLPAEPGWSNPQYAQRFTNLAQLTRGNWVQAAIYDQSANWMLQISEYSKLGHQRSFWQLVRAHYSPSAPTSAINREVRRSRNFARGYKKLVNDKWEEAAHDFAKRNDGLQLEQAVRHEKDVYRRYLQNPRAIVEETALAQGLLPITRQAKRQNDTFTSHIKH